jgi:hypothetical protein
MTSIRELTQPFYYKRQEGETIICIQVDADSREAVEEAVNAIYINRKPEDCRLVKLEEHPRQGFATIIVLKNKSSEN